LLPGSAMGYQIAEEMSRAMGHVQDQGNPFVERSRSRWAGHGADGHGAAHQREASRGEGVWGALNRIYDAEHAHERMGAGMIDEFQEMFGGTMTELEHQ